MWPVEGLGGSGGWTEIATALTASTVLTVLRMIGRVGMRRMVGRMRIERGALRGLWGGDRWGMSIGCQLLFYPS